MRLELKKMVLLRASFNTERFHIELEQAMKKLNPSERLDLMIWVKNEFGARFPIVIDRVFHKKSDRISIGL